MSYVVDTIHRQCCSYVLSQNKLLRESNQERDNVTKKKLLQKESKSNRIEVIFLLPKVGFDSLVSFSNDHNDDINASNYVTIF